MQKIRICRQPNCITTNSTIVNEPRNLIGMSFITNGRTLRSCLNLREIKTKILLARTTRRHKIVRQPVPGMSETFETAQEISSFIARMARQLSFSSHWNSFHGISANVKWKQTHLSNWRSLPEMV